MAIQSLVVQDALHAQTADSFTIYKYLQTWGTDANGYGVLGQGATGTSLSPANVGSSSWDTLSVSGTGFHALGLISGKLWVWGNNSNGQLGLNDTVIRNVPTQVGALTTWAKLSAGDSHSLAIKTDGTLWAWGSNGSGRLGLGDYTDRHIPTQVGTGTNWAYVSAGGEHSLAIKTDGTLWTWGRNYFGELGIGNNTDKNAPVQVGVLTKWTDIAAGYAHSLALQGGKLWAAGANNQYQLGDGSGVNKNVFIQISGAVNWSKISAADSHSAGILADGTLWVWGANTYGQLAIGDTAVRYTPAQIGVATNWSDLNASTDHTFAIDSTGNLYGGGNNSYGELGLGDTTQRIALTSISTSISRIYGGFDFTVALTSSPFSGTATLSLSISVPLDTYMKHLALSAVVYATTGYANLFLSSLVQATGHSALSLSVAVSVPNNIISLPLRVSVNSPGSAALPLPISVIPNKLGQFNVWRPVVILGGVDVSARLTGSIRIEAEEGAARIAEFTLVPQPGTVLPTSWVGVALTIDYAAQDSSGAALYAVRRFTGVVDVPDYDPVRKTTLFHCTDDLQGTLAASARTVLAALIGGYWSEAALGVPLDNLAYAKSRMSTVAASLDMSPWRAPRVTPWAAKATPDFSLAAGDVIDNSITLSLAYRGILRNQVQISFGYRYRLARLRVMQFDWAWPIGRQYYDQVMPPYGSTIIGAITTTGWEIISKVFTNDPIYALYKPEDAPVLSATVRIGKKYSQTVTEQYGITVSASLSVAALRANSSQRSATLDAPWDPTPWEATPILLNGFSQDNVTLIGFGTASLSLALVVQDTGPAAAPMPHPPALTIGTATGESIQVMTQPGINDRAAADAAIAALIAAAQVEILSSHRGNQVSGSLPLAPMLDLVHTLYVSAGGITAQGKIRRLVDRMDMDSGAAITEVTLALSSANASGVQPPTSTPVAPFPPAYYMPNAALVKSWYLNLDTYLGAAPNSVMPYSTGWAGWILNLHPTIKICGDIYLGQKGTSDCAEFYNRDYRPLNLYPVNEFRVFASGIEQAFRYPSQLTKNAGYDVSIPEDLLTITA